MSERQKPNMDMWGKEVDIPEGYFQVLPSQKSETKLGDKVISMSGNWLDVIENDGSYASRHSPTPGTPIKYSTTIRKIPSRLKKVVDISIKRNLLVIPFGWQMIKGIAKDGDKYWSPFIGEWSYIRARHIGEHTSQWSCPVIRKAEYVQHILPSNFKIR